MTITLYDIHLSPDPKTQALVDQWMCWWIGGPEAAIDTLAWELIIKPRVFNQPGNDPGIIAGAYRRIERYLPVLDKQLESCNYVVGPLTIVDFLIGPRLDTAPAILKFDTSRYANIGAWQERLTAKPYWSTA